MPIYEYRCLQCGHYVEVLQKLSEDPLRNCDACQTDNLKKMVSAPRFRLKGSGWYETDFKSDKEKKKNLTDIKPKETKTDTNEKSASSLAKAEKKEGTSDTKKIN